MWLRFIILLPSVLLFFFVATLGAKVSFSQSDKALQLVEPNAFEERFTGNSNVSGTLLSGIVYVGRRSSNFDMDKVFVRIRSHPASPILCVQLQSADGRYWALNGYSVGPPSRSFVPLSHNSKLATKLSSYRIEDMLLRAFLGERCDISEKGALIPGALSEHPDAKILRVFVNANRGKISTKITNVDGKMISEAICKKPASGEQVAYSHLCDLTIPYLLEPDIYDLVIGIKGLTGKQLARGYKILLP